MSSCCPLSTNKESKRVLFVTSTLRRGDNFSVKKCIFVADKRFLKPQIMFEVYDSFSRLEQAAFGKLSWDGKVRIVSRWKCDLSKDYYWGEVAISEPEPFSKKYQPIYGWYCRAFKSIKNTKTQAVKPVNLLA